MRSKARLMAVAAAVATAVCLTGSAAASASPPDTAKARAVAAAEAKGKPGKPAEDRAGIERSLAKGVAARLGVSLASAQQAVKELFALAEGPHGVDPHSAEFAAIAKELAVSPARFEEALAAAKQALGKQVVEEKGKDKGKDKDKGKPGDGKPVIKHRGPDDAGAVQLFAEAVAARLDVDTASAERAVKELFALADGPHGLDPRSAEFAAIAKELGVSPAQFEEALAAAKQGLAAGGQSSKG
ncbi:hypothetical protein [Actinopolymorpha pittospori]